MEATFADPVRALKAQLPGEANIRRPPARAAETLTARLCPVVVHAKLSAMEELLRSNDPVYLSYVRHVLAEAGIEHMVLDEHMSALEGSIGILPRRILVASADAARARLALGNAALTLPP